LSREIRSEIIYNRYWLPKLWGAHLLVRNAKNWTSQQIEAVLGL